MRGNEMGSSDAHGGGGYGERDFKWVDVDENFAKQMKAAGVDPQHRIAIAVSGGADSMALCQLAVRWKRRSPEIAAGKCDGLFGYVVDHGLRSGSAEEAMRVQQWVSNLGFSCDILKCVWVDGVPALGHLQESARNARYALLAQACQRTGVEILLTAHHADDQAELFILRLSRCSGIAGLAGMASAISLYPALSPCAMTKFISCNLLLIRPLLKFVKEDLYAVCQKSGQNWVEDPTNGNLSFARNRIRKALKEVSFMAVRTEIQELIVFCRKMRTILDRDCGRLLSEVAQVSQIPTGCCLLSSAFVYISRSCMNTLTDLSFVTWCDIKEWGYVTIKVEKLLSSGVSHAVLHRTVAALMQFAAQKVKPPRGRAVASVVKHLRAKNSKGVFTVGGCNVFPAPGSKGSIIIICFSPDSPPPSALSTVYLDQCPQSSSSDSATSYPRVPVLPHAFPGDPVPDELMADSISKASLLALDIKTPRTAVNEFKGLGLISAAGANLLKELSSTLSLDMCKHPVNQSEEAFTAKGNSISRECVKIPLSCGGSKHFMDRFVVSLSSRDQERVKQGAQPSVFDIDAKPSPTDCCLMRQKMWIRHFEEKDWVYLLQIAETGTLSLRDNLKADMMPSDTQRQYLGDMDCKAPSTHYTKAHSSSVAARSNVFSSLMASNPSCGVNYSSRELLKVDPCRTLCCKIQRLLKAKQATAQLRNVPKLVRRGLPVVITCHGLLLGMPSVGYSHCSLASMKAIFRPGTPLGGAQASWL